MVLACAGVFGALGGSVTQAMVADLVPRERHEKAYASVRIAQNLGVTMGPPIGGVYLLVGGWPLLFVGVAALSAVGWLLAFRFPPRRGAYAPAGPPERGSFGVIRRDGVFLVYLVSGVFAYLVYVAYEAVLGVLRRVLGARGGDGLVRVPPRERGARGARARARGLTSEAWTAAFARAS